MKNKLSVLTLIFVCSVAIIFGMKPENKYLETPKKYGFAYEELKVKTIDNFTINMWHIMPKLKGVDFCKLIMQFCQQNV